MLTEDEIFLLTEETLIYLGLFSKGWRACIVDRLEHIEEAFGFTCFETKQIMLTRQFWPTYDENILELIRHESAHALYGSGEHNREWWDLLIKIGGNGIWLEDGVPASCSLTLAKIEKGSS